MQLSNGDTGDVLWRSDKWVNALKEEQEAHLPLSVLSCRVVAREISFSSRHAIHNFNLHQRIFVQDYCVEEWHFDFGFVIPESENTWQNIIESAGPGQMMSAKELSGNMVIETTFFDHCVQLATSYVRIYYD